MLLPRCLLFLLLASPGMLAVAEPVVRDAWIRALPPTQPVTAAYAEVSNTGPTAIALVGARVEGAGRVEIHTNRDVDGLIRMERLSTLSIPAGQTVSLAPGGSHFMLFELAGMPRPGEQRQVCLLFADAGEQCVTAAVRKSATTDHSHHQHH